MHRHGRAAFISTAVALFAAAASAAPHRDRPPLVETGSAAVSPGGTFVCGTSGGNEVRTHYFAQKHARLVSDIARGRAPAPVATLDYVYDDVWVVEDDGTLLFSGLNAFDTDMTTVHFAPNVDGSWTASAVAFAFDAVPGSSIPTGDDGAVLVSLPFAFDFSGTWTDMYVGGNGLVSFGGLPDPAGFYDADDFFNTTPKICPYFMDFNPAAGGAVYGKSEATKYTVTWSAVPDYGTANLNTVQLVLYDDGTFDITFNGITSLTQANGSPVIAGFSLGTPADLEVMSYSDDLPYTGAIGKAFYEDYLNITNPIVNEVGLFQRFYSHFPDEFFQLVYFSNFVQTMGGFANERNIKNDVQGIGLGIFDNSGSYGSSGVLESRCNMNRLSVWPALPDTRFFTDGNSFLTIMGQEAGHRWGAFMNFVDSNNQVSNLILGRSDAHWSYFVDNDHSSLEGGNWDETAPNSFVCPTQIDFFPGVDEYAFGLRTPEEVKDLFYIDSPSNNLPQNRDDGTPLLGATATGTPVTVTIDDIIAAEGPRNPAEGDEAKDLRQGWILIVQSGNMPTQGQLDQIAGFRRGWEEYFERSCDGRLTCNTSLTQNFTVSGVAGTLVNKYTDEPITSEFTATSIERGFVQNVPGGGRWFFRYQADGGSGPSEGVTIAFEAAGYYPDTLLADVAYGADQDHVVELIPVPTSVTPGTSLPNALYPNYPNPFNPSTTIRFDMAAAASVELTVFDVRGAVVRTLERGTRLAGIHEVLWDGRDDRGVAVPSGMYFYRLVTGDFVRTRKMLLVK